MNPSTQPNQTLFPPAKSPRRNFLQQSVASALAASSISWNDLVKGSASQLRRQNRHCILLWMHGGPSQLETFDPKPGTDQGGPTEAIQTSVPGIYLAQHWPCLSQIAGDVAFIRSVTNREGNHQRARYQLHTGYLPGGGLKHPHFGSVISKEKGTSRHDLPDFVSIGRTLDAGFLGTEFSPFTLKGQRPPENTRLTVPEKRHRKRLSLLEDLETEFSSPHSKTAVKTHQTLYERASRLMLTSKLKAFDLSNENDSVREAYGRTDFGQGCLLARRLIEAGVTFVEVVCRGWDTHQDNFSRHAELAGAVDPAFAQLVSDLKRRNLLDSTLIIWMGEFGRTPRINPRTGRDHFPKAFNIALSGGGVRGGQIIGKTSADGMEVVKRPVEPKDLFCSFCHSLKLDPRTETMSPVGRPIKIVEGGTRIDELFG